jgi:MFS family permease
MDSTIVSEPKNTLWTRDFTIITIGSVISMFGNSLVGFAMSLMVLDYTNSPMLYAVYTVMYTLPQLIMPIISGAILDRFSRKKMIYTLDFVSAAVYLVMGILLNMGLFNFVIFAIVSFALGCIQSTYMVAYDSFYPLLITEGNYQKAYSISSMLETIAMFMVPVATFVYNLIGIGPLMVLNAVTFFVAAAFETQIQHEEDYIEQQKKNSDVENIGYTKQMLLDIKEGFKYLSQEKGLRAVAVYFMFSCMAGGAMNVMCLPYYKSNFENGEYLFIFVYGMSFIGRAIGGGIHYRFKIPTKYKYRIALCVYLFIGVIEGTFMFMPSVIASICCFFVGIGGITSYTIRISSTQNYVPDEKKGRFNGALMLLMTVGSLIAQLLSGIMSERVDPRYVVLIFNMIAVAAAILIIGGNRKEVSKIYNTDN